MGEPVRSRKKEDGALMGRVNCSGPPVPVLVSTGVHTGIAQGELALNDVEQSGHGGELEAHRAGRRGYER